MISNQETHRIRTNSDSKTFVERLTDDMRMMTNTETALSDLSVKWSCNEPQIKSPVNCRDSRWPASVTQSVATSSCAADVCESTCDNTDDNIEAGLLEDANAMRLELERAGRDEAVRSGCDRDESRQEEYQTVE